MEKNLTAVEWLVEQYKKVGGISISMAEIAKEMEKNNTDNKHLPDNEVLGEPKQEQRKMIMKKLKQIGKELIALTALILCLILIPNPIMYLIGCWQLGSWFGYLTKKL
jgi:hypothetical protein